MNLIRAAAAIEQLATSAGQVPIAVSAQRCVHALNKFAECTHCVDVCPVKAIRLDRGPILDATQCVNCGACLHSCPTEAFSGEDRLPRLLRCIANLPDPSTIELACMRQSDSVPGAMRSEAIVRITGCLAALGPSAYASLSTLGVKQIGLRLDLCAQCPIGSLKQEILRVADAARDLMQASDFIQIIEKPGFLRGKRDVISVTNPPLTRRAFFRQLALQADSASSILSALMTEDGTSDRVPRERRMLLKAIRRVKRPIALKRSLGFVRMEAKESCTACGTCARVCPTKALTFTTDDKAFQLSFDAGACTDCGVCLTYCQPKALQRRDEPVIQEMIGVPITLAMGDLRKCQKCGARFAGAEDEKFCPVCNFRRNNPMARASFLPSRNKSD